MPNPSRFRSETVTEQRIRVPINTEQHAKLAELLRAVPARKVVHYDWKSEAGQVFITELRKVQLTGVPLPWIARSIDVSTYALNGAVGYWQRNSAARGSVRRMRERRRLLRETSRLTEATEPEATGSE
jgi:hypothetical protein